MALHLGITSCLTLKAAKCAHNTLIELILYYTDTVWGELSATSSKTLQRLQTRAACIVLRRDSPKDLFNVVVVVVAIIMVYLLKTLFRIP